MASLALRPSEKRRFDSGGEMSERDGCAVMSRCHAATCPSVSVIHPLEPALRAGLAALGLPLTDGQVAQLLDYLALLQKWNKVYNLTAVRGPDDMLTYHLLDSLAVIRPLLRHVNGRRVRLLDVGSGGGLPGAVVAICCPNIEVDCVDTVAKKAAFLRQVASGLGLANLHGLHDRVEHLAGPYDVIASRAFASLSDFISWSSGALAQDGVWLAMKGKLPDDEIAALATSVTVFHVEQLTVPGLAASRCLIWLRPTADVT